MALDLFTPDIIEFKQGEKGEIYPITIYNRDGSLANLSSFTGASMKFISSKDRQVLVTVATVTVFNNSGNPPTESVPHQVRWSMIAAETNIPDTEAGDDHIAHVELTSASVTRMLNPDPVVRVLKNKSVTIS